MGSHDPFGHLWHKLWQKERPRVKLVIWLPTMKSRESTRLPCVHVACNTLLENFRQEIQLYFRPRPNRRFEHEVIAPQSCGSPNPNSFGTFLRELQHWTLRTSRWSATIFFLHDNYAFLLWQEVKVEMAKEEVDMNLMWFFPFNKPFGCSLCGEVQSIL
jgi:hypothetical protein